MSAIAGLLDDVTLLLFFRLIICLILFIFLFLFIVSSFLVRLLCLAVVVTATGEDSTVPKCPADEFACDSVGCYTNDQRCDGVNHCADGRDELDCRKIIFVV